MKGIAYVAFPKDIFGKKKCFLESFHKTSIQGAYFRKSILYYFYFQVKKEKSEHKRLERAENNSNRSWVIRHN